MRASAASLQTLLKLSAITGSEPGQRGFTPPESSRSCSTETKCLHGSVCKGPVRVLPEPLSGPVLADSLLWFGPNDRWKNAERSSLFTQRVHWCLSWTSCWVGGPSSSGPTGWKCWSADRGQRSSCSSMWLNLQAQSDRSAAEPDPMMEMTHLEQKDLLGVHLLNYVDLLKNAGHPEWWDVSTQTSVVFEHLITRWWKMSLVRSGWAVGRLDSHQRSSWRSGASEHLKTDLQDEQVGGGQDEQPLVGGSEAQDGSVRVQAGHLLLGHLSHLASLLPVEEDGVHGGRLAVDEGAAETLAQRCEGEVGSAGGELLILLGRLNVTCDGHKVGGA